MSMRARPSGGRSRFERARDGARELLASAREGDAVAVVLAGTPARVALAATTDLDAARRRHRRPRRERSGDRPRRRVGARARARRVPSAGRPAHRGPQRLGRRSTRRPAHRRGRPRAPLGRPARAARGDPRLRRHARRPQRRPRERPRRVRARRDRGGARLVVEDAKGKVLGHAPPPTGADAEVTVLLPRDDAAPVRARLAGSDAVAARRRGAGLPRGRPRGASRSIADATDESVATGGAPIVEQALSALKLDVDVRPIPALPDRAEDLAGTIGVLLDDPPGLTPEQRHALGGIPRRRRRGSSRPGPSRGGAPLGATLEPVLAHAVAWTETSGHGADPASAVGALAESAQSLTDLSAPAARPLRPRTSATSSRSFDGSTGRRSSRAGPWAAARRGSSPCPSPSTRATSRCGRRSSRCSTRGRPRHASTPRPGAATSAPRGAPRRARRRCRGPGGAVSVGARRRRRPRRAPARRRLPHHRGRQDRDAGRGAGRARARPAPASGGRRAAGEGMGEHRASVDVSGADRPGDAGPRGRRNGAAGMEPAQNGGGLTMVGGDETEANPRAGPTCAPKACQRLVPIGLAALLLAGCHSAGPYGHAPRYVELDDETTAASGAREYDPVMVERQPDEWRKGKTALFGVVESRSAGSGGQALLKLSVRRLEPRNLCENEQRRRLLPRDRERQGLRRRLRPRRAPRRRRRGAARGRAEVAAAHRRDARTGRVAPTARPSSTRTTTGTGHRSST